MKVRLDVFHNKEKVRRVVIKNDTMIGRGKECSLRIASSQVSRQHCKLMLSGTEVLIRDLGSSNGTYVNGKKIGKGVALTLNNKDIFAVGSYQFRVKFAPYMHNDTTVHLPPDPVDIPMKRTADALTEQEQTAAQVAESISLDTNDKTSADKTSADAATVSPTDRNSITRSAAAETLPAEEVAATEADVKQKAKSPIAEPDGLDADGLDNETPLVNMNLQEPAAAEEVHLTAAEPVAASPPTNKAEQAEAPELPIAEAISNETPAVVEAPSAEIPVAVEDSAVELPVAQPLPVAAPVTDALPVDADETPIVMDRDDDDEPVAVPEDEDDEAIELPVAVPVANQIDAAEQDESESESNFNFNFADSVSDESDEGIVAAEVEEVEIEHAIEAEEVKPERKKKGGLFGLFGKKDSVEVEADTEDEVEPAEAELEAAEMEFADEDEEPLAFPDDEDEVADFDPDTLPAFDTEESAQSSTSDNDLNNFLNQLE